MTRRNQSSENLEVSQEEQMVYNPSGWRDLGAFEKSKAATWAEA